MQFEDARNYILNRLKNDLPVCYHYHNVDHTRDVVQAAERIADHEGLAGQEKSLLLTAVLRPKLDISFDTVL